MKSGSLPSNPESEKGLLCSIMLATNAALTMCVSASITTAHFYDPRHSLMYGAMVELWAISGDANLDNTIVSPFLRKKSITAKCGGEAYIAEILMFTPTAAMASQHIENIKEAYALRQAILAFNEGASRCHRPEGATALEIIGEISAKLTDAAAQKSIQSMTDSAFEEVEAMWHSRDTMSEFSEPLGLPWGVCGFDTALRGIFQGEMYVVVGAPGCGKTSAIEATAEINIETGKHVLILQKDMPVATMIGRMAARRAHVRYSAFKTGHATSGELVAFREALDELKQFKDHLHIYNPDGLTAPQLDALVRAEKQRHDISMFMLDHFFQLKFEGRSNLPEKAMEASMALRRTITETKVPGIILVHLTRDAQKKKQKPTPSDVKWCDQLYCDCDAMGILWSDDDPPPDPATNHEVTLSIVKNRTGAKPDEKMQFCQRFAQFLPY